MLIFRIKLESYLCLIKNDRCHKDVSKRFLMIMFIKNETNGANNTWAAENVFDLFDVILKYIYLFIYSNRRKTYSNI